MATHSTLQSLFSDIADAIRSKDATSEKIVADVFPDKIRSIPSSDLVSLDVAPGGVEGTLSYVASDGTLKTTQTSEIASFKCPRYSVLFFNTVSTSPPVITGGITLVNSVQNATRQYYYTYYLKDSGTFTP